MLIYIENYSISTHKIRNININIIYLDITTKGNKMCFGKIRKIKPRKKEGTGGVEYILDFMVYFL